MKKYIVLVVLLLLVIPTIRADEKTDLQTTRAKYVRWVEDIDQRLDEIAKDEQAKLITEEQQTKLKYYQEVLEKDNPVPKDYGKPVEIVNDIDTLIARGMVTDTTKENQ